MAFPCLFFPLPPSLPLSLCSQGVAACCGQCVPPPPTVPQEDSCQVSLRHCAGQPSVDGCGSRWPGKGCNAGLCGEEEEERTVRVYMRDCTI